MDELEIRRIKNAEKYLSDKWQPGLLGNLYIHDAIKESLDIFQKQVLKYGVDVVYRGARIHFDCLTKKDLNFGFKFEDLILGGMTEKYDRR